MPLTFRRATGPDVALVRDISRAAYAKWVPLIGREPKPMTADYAHAVVAHIVDLGLAGDGRPVGLIEVVPEPGCLLIENIAVLPEAQGTGAGGRSAGARRRDRAQARTGRRAPLHERGVRSQHRVLCPARVHGSSA